ncbi:hypothetical protein [Sicyoidochytrium minutum DNA virus]|nr:hypothetical protein [Sicyoidochytrium minutum DNA virus]
MFLPMTNNPFLCSSPYPKK